VLECNGKKKLKRLVDFHSFVGGSAGRFGLILIKENVGCNVKPYQKIPRDLTFSKQNKCAIYVNVSFNSLSTSKDDFLAERTSLYLQIALHGRDRNQSALCFGYSQCSLW